MDPISSPSAYVALEADHLRKPAPARAGVRRPGRPLVRGQVGAGLRRRRQQPAGADVPPSRLRDMVVENRVVVSPMAMYWAVDGVPGDWHLVHLRQPRPRRRRRWCSGDDLSLAGGPHHAGGTGLWNESERAWAADRRFVHAIRAEDLHAARPLRAQGLDEAGVGAHGLSAGGGRLATCVGLAVPYIRTAGAAGMTAPTGPHRRRVRRSGTPRRRAGFDMLEIHWRTATSSQLHLAADQPAQGRIWRTLENRMRFPLEMFEACTKPGRRTSRCRCASRRPTGARAGSTAKRRPGRARLRGAGSTRSTALPATVAEPRPIYGRMYQTPFAERIRNRRHRHCRVGPSPTADQVNTILAAGAPTWSRWRGRTSPIPISP